MRLRSAILVALSTGTGRALGGAEIPFLTWDARGQRVFMQALSGGVLVREGQCTYLATGEHRTILVLPNPYARWDARRSTIILGGRGLRFGDEIRIGEGVGVLHGVLRTRARQHGCRGDRLWLASPQVVGTSITSTAEVRRSKPVGGAR